MIIYAIVAAFIAVDFVSGLIKAFSSNDFQSRYMRQGLYHKTGELLCMVLGVLVDYAQMYLDLGINIPVGTAICVYITLMEIGSTLENICIICPELSPARLKAIFGVKGDTK